MRSSRKAQATTPVFSLSGDKPVRMFSEVGASQRQVSEGPGHSVSGSPSQLHSLDRGKDFTLIEPPQRNRRTGNGNSLTIITEKQD